LHETSYSSHRFLVVIYVLGQRHSPIKSVEMLSLLDIFLLVFKYSWFITFVTLSYTATGWQIGFSHLYLKLIEAIFHFGQKHIEKAESEHKITSASNYDDDAEDDNADSNSEEEKKTRSESSSRSSQLASRPEKVKRLSPDAPPVFLLGDNCESQHEFQLDDACTLVNKGITAIIDDQVTKRFNTEELRSWNLLTRTNIRNYQFMSVFLGFSWLLGFIVRYLILLPLRIMFTFTGIIWLICSMALVGCLPEPLRSQVFWHVSLMSFRMLSCGLTATLEFHNQQYRAKKGDICVANHTSPIDVVVLACDNCYALVGQRHGGFLGMLEKALSRATNHVWFDRSEMRDRQFVVKRLKEHVSSKANFPILIFPEGTCINNSAVMMFKKGSFEATDRVCPVAIKYDPRFGDPFWNSSKQGYMQYLLLMMSSWAIKCDVWYLPPMERLADETSAEFANRVKSEIARQGGLVDLAWDGQLKRTLAKTEWREKQQEDFARRLKLE